MIYQSPGGVGMRFKMGKLNINNIIINNHIMKSIVIPEIYGLGEPGKPYLPQINRLVALPQGASASVQLLNSKTYEISGVVPWCSPESLPYNNVNSIIFKPDSSVYYGYRPYPEQIIRVSEPFKIRGLDVVQVTIEPFQWDPRDSVLTVYTSVNINVAFFGGNGLFGEDRLRSRYWDRIYSCNVINFRSLRDIDYSKRVIEKQALVDAGYPYGAEFVIIVPDDEDFINAAETIKDLRQEEGIITEIYTLSEVGNTFYDIQAWIDYAYYCWSIPPEAVLLLGDYPDEVFTIGIPSRRITISHNTFWSFASDNYYADVDKDELPDITFGRIPARDSVDLDNSINKLLFYELTPLNEPLFYENVLVSGNFQYHNRFDHHVISEIMYGFYDSLGKDVERLYNNHFLSSPAYEILEPGSDWMPGGIDWWLPGLVEYFSSLGYIEPFVSVDFLDTTIWNKDGDDVKNVINNGCFMVHNNGHGWPYWWGQPRFEIGHVNALTNDNKIPFVFALGCWTGKFDSSLSNHAEVFYLHEPSPLTGQSRGAIGLTAASHQWGDANSHFLGMMDCMWPNFDPMYPFYEDDTSHQALPGFALVSGKYYMVCRNSNWKYESGNLSARVVFHHFGDPYLRLYTELPQNLSVSMFPFLPAGANICNVNATVNSMISLISNGEVIGRKLALPGWTTIDIIPQDYGSEIEVVVTKQNYYRYYDTISVSIQNGTYLRFQEIYNIDGGYNINQIIPGHSYKMVLRFINFGNQSADSFWINLSTDDSLVNLYDTALIIIDSVNALDTIDLLFNFSINDSTQDQYLFEFDLDYGYKNSDSFSEVLNLEVNRPEILLDDIDDGTPYYPGDTFYFSLMFENSGSGDEHDLEIKVTIENTFVHSIDTLDTIALLRGKCDIYCDSIFCFKLSSDFADTIIPYHLEIKSEQFTNIVVIDTIRYPKGLFFKEYFENGLSQVAFTGDSSWCLTNTANHTPGYLIGHSLYCGDDSSHLYANNVTNSRAFFQQYTSSKDNFFMTFWHKYQLEEGKDGVQVEYKFFGDSLWTLLETSEGYTDTSLGYGGFNIGDKFYSGDYNIWHEQHFHYSQTEILPESLYISWRFGSNDTITMEGYYLDDIAVMYHATIPMEKDVLYGKTSTSIIDNEYYGIYPNPVRNKCCIRFSVLHQQNVTLTIFDVAGRKVRTLLEADLMPGSYIAEWDCRDSENYQVSSGIYYFILQKSNDIECNKIVVIR